MKHKRIALLVLAAMLLALLSGCAGSSESASTAPAPGHYPQGQDTPGTPVQPTGEDLSDTLTSLGCGYYSGSAAIRNTSYTIVPMDSWGKDGMLYVRTDDNRIFDGLNCKNNLLEGKNPVRSFLGPGYYGYEDQNGAMHFQFRELASEAIAYGFTGSLVHAYRDGNTVLISESNHRLTLSAFDNSGSPVDGYTNMPYSFVDISPAAGDPNHPQVYDTFKNLQIGLSNTFGANWPSIRFTAADGSEHYGYVMFRVPGNFLCSDVLPADCERILAVDQDRAMYAKKGVSNKLFYQISDSIDAPDGEYAVNLPDGFTVNDVKQLDFDNRVVVVLFRNGSFYAGKTKPIAGGVNLQNIDVLSQIGADMIEFYRDEAADSTAAGKQQYKVNFRMSDNQLYYYYFTLP